ncbi:hypothetical protein OHS18_40905 [Amycolatopsis sp. NBC_00355]|uniref:hypothetical protein n=1 Tax=Amycolatopsis sp. NBC_00355 TaxID=2975957 RepID=UPI002E25F2E9
MAEDAGGIGKTGKVGRTGRTSKTSKTSRIGKTGGTGETGRIGETGESESGERRLEAECLERPGGAGEPVGLRTAAGQARGLDRTSPRRGQAPGEGVGKLVGI